LLTIRKETGSWFWTGVSFLLPTTVGILLCILVNLLGKLAVLLF
jgi:ferrous iron transport protein B